MADDGTKCFDRVLLDEIRSRFLYVDADPIAGERVYLESAGGSLTLRTAADAANELAGLPDNAGRDNVTSRYIDGMIERGIGDVRAVVGDGPGVIQSGESTTANVFRVVEAICASRRGNIVTTQLEHPCTYSATRYYAARYGLDWRVAHLQPSDGVVTRDAIMRHVDKDTAAVVFVHASNVIGTRIDVRAVAEAVAERSRNTLIVVDGTQHAPHAPVDVGVLGVDAYFFAPYKMFSTIGTCFAWLGPRVASLDHPRLAGTSTDRWNLGTRQPASFAAWSRTVDYLAWLGEHIDHRAGGRRGQVLAAMRAIEAHERALTAHLLDGLGHIRGVRVFGLCEAGPMREAVVAFARDGCGAGEMVRRCVQRGVIVHDRKHDAYSGVLLSALGAPDCVRVSLGHYNRPEDIDVLLDAIG